MVDLAVIANLSLAFVLEGVIYGVFFALAIVSLALQAHCHSDDARIRIGTGPDRLSIFAGLRKREHVAATIWLLVVITAHWLLRILPLFETYIFSRGEVATAVYTNLQHPLEVVRETLLLVSILNFDALLMLRTWRIRTEGHWRTIILILLTAEFVVCAGAIFRLIVSNGEDSSLLVLQMSHWLRAVALCTTCIRLCGSLLIAFRMQSIRSVKKISWLPLQGRILIFVQSSLLASIWTTLLTAIYFEDSTTFGFTVACSPAIGGIAFVLVGICAALTSGGSVVSGEKSQAARQ